MRNLLVTIIFLAIGVCQLAAQTQHMTTTGKKQPVDTTIIDRAMWAIQDVFEPVKQDAFHVEVTARKDTSLQAMKEQEKLQLFLANRQNEPVVTAPVITDFSGMKMSINYNDIKKENAPMPASVAEIVMNIRGDEEPDLDFLKSKSFMFRGESFENLSDEEIDRIQHSVKHTKKAKQSKKATRKNVQYIPDLPTFEEAIDYCEDMAQDGEEYGVPDYITLAQMLLESRGTRSFLATQFNNFFGIKDSGGNCTKKDCFHTWVYDDYKEGPDRHKESFKGYATPQEGFDAHIKFFLNSDRYNEFLAAPMNDIQAKLYLLGRSGYALDKDYDRKLAKLIRKYGLYTDGNGNVIKFKYDREETRKRLRNSK